jgi:hypothetical protein
VDTCCALAAIAIAATAESVILWDFLIRPRTRALKVSPASFEIQPNSISGRNCVVSGQKNSIFESRSTVTCQKSAGLSPERDPEPRALFEGERDNDTGAPEMLSSYSWIARAFGKIGVHGGTPSSTGIDPSVLNGAIGNYRQHSFARPWFLQRKPGHRSTPGEGFTPELETWRSLPGVQSCHPLRGPRFRLQDRADHDCRLPGHGIPLDRSGAS